MRRFSWLPFFLAPMLMLGVSAGHADTLHFQAHLTGPAENPPVPSPGIGDVVVLFDTETHTLLIHADWSDLIGTTTVAHIHCCVDPPGLAGVAVTPGTLPGFPVGVTAGTYDVVLDLTLAATYTGGFLGGGTVAGAEAALLDGLLDGRAYFNIHTTFRPGGEIREFLALVPMPGTLALVVAGLAGLGVALRRRQS